MTVIVKTIIIVNVVVTGNIAVIEIGNVIRRNVEIKRCNLCLTEKLDIVKAEWDSRFSNTWQPPACTYDIDGRSMTKNH